MPPDKNLGESTGLVGHIHTPGTEILGGFGVPKIHGTKSGDGVWLVHYSINLLTTERSLVTSNIKVFLDN